VKCPKCHFADTKVLESRVSVDGGSVRRRRSCLSCNHRFTTYEKAEEFVFQVEKKDGRFEIYQREKALRSIQIACQKRPVNLDHIESLLSAIERKLQEEGERVVTSRRVGDLIMDALRELDHVAYVRFASVYKEFRDPAEFISELQSLQPRGGSQNES
jgi:transcriptional repressor NrdR